MEQIEPVDGKSLNLDLEFTMPRTRTWNPEALVMNNKLESPEQNFVRRWRGV